MLSVQEILTLGEFKQPSLVIWHQVTFSTSINDESTIVISGTTNNCISHLAPNNVQYLHKTIVISGTQIIGLVVWHHNLC